MMQLGDICCSCTDEYINIHSDQNTELLKAFRRPIVFSLDRKLFDELLLTDEPDQQIREIISQLWLYAMTSAGELEKFTFSYEVENGHPILIEAEAVEHEKSDPQIVFRFAGYRHKEQDIFTILMDDAHML